MAKPSYDWYQGRCCKDCGGVCSVHDDDRSPMTGLATGLLLTTFFVVGVLLGAWVF